MPTQRLVRPAPALRALCLEVIERSAIGHCGSETLLPFASFARLWYHYKTNWNHGKTMAVLTSTRVALLASPTWKEPGATTHTSMPGDSAHDVRPCSQRGNGQCQPRGGAVHSGTFCTSWSNVFEAQDILLLSRDDAGWLGSGGQVTYGDYVVAFFFIFSSSSVVPFCS